MSVTTNDDGSRLVVSGAAGVWGAAIRAPSEPVVVRTPHVSTWKTILKSIGYWAAWVGFGAWAVRCDHYYLMNGWWMVLLFFWLTANEVEPAHNARGRYKWFIIGAGTLAAAFLVYGTFEWLVNILEGWSLGGPKTWLLVASLPMRALIASTWTAIALVPQLRRAFGPHSEWLFVITALPTGIAEYGLDFTNWVQWHAHWLSNYIRMFIIVILPLILVATSERLTRLPRPKGTIITSISRLWRGDVPTWVALLVVYPLTIIGVFWLDGRYNDLPNQGYSDWEYANRRAIEWVLLVVLLIVGSMVTWRCLNRSAKRGMRIARWLQGIIALIAAPFLLITLLGDGFAVGNIINNSAKAALGSAYDIQVPDQSVELRLSGEINYGLTNRLTKELDAHPGVSRIRLDSGGGATDEALRAAKIIAARELDTVVSGECASSCTDLFMAGKHRILEKDGRLGFHAAMRADPTKESGGYFRSVYTPYGVDKGFIARVEATKPSDMWYPTREELVSAHILTAAQ